MTQPCAKIGDARTKKAAPKGGLMSV
ncbi:hypothetical protein EE36_13788 [Sulfitobacter sp. EE-36]|nr:hypothetical protein EE36_13788 [Sulfitobacter sp. EE-36]